MKKILLFILSLSSLFSFSQCPYPASNSQINGIQTFCVDAPGRTLTVNARTDKFIIANVVQGFQYKFTIANVYTSLSESITIYNATTNAPLANNTGVNGTSVDWTATFSGEIKIIVSQGSCDHSNTATVALTLQLIAVGNTIDISTNSGTDTWIGHVYNWSGGGLPPGGNTIPATPTDTFPFTASNYVGYYNVPSESLLETFGGGNDACFPVFSDGIVRTAVRSETFAVRYRMTSTRPAGCYIIQLKGDDGIRLYNNGTLVFKEWRQQAPTSYNNVLVYLDGSADLVLEYYENTGQNVVDLSITPFATASNTIANPAERVVCNNTSAGILDGSAFAYTGSTINPTIAFQWQVSTDNITFTNIAGINATREDYAPAPIVNLGPSNTVRYYRRTINAASSAVSCNSASNVIKVTTTPDGSIPGSATATAVTCTSFIANWNTATNANSYHLDVATTPTFNPGTYFSIYNNRNVGTATSLSIAGVETNTTYYYRVRAVYACGTSGNSTVRNVTTNGYDTPVALSATTVACDGFTANWSLVSGATGYYIDIATTPTFNAGSFITGYENLIIGNMSNIKITNVTTNPIYYRVRATGTCGITSNSNVITVIRTATTWNGTTWDNGIPTIATLAILNGDYNTAANGDFDCCSLIVNTGFTLDIEETNKILIQNDLTVNGTFNVEDKGSLIQVNDLGINMGVISYERKTTGKPLDYVYWSSPVAGANTPSGVIYKWNPTYNNPNGGQGYWIGASNAPMQTGVGYIMRNIFTSNFVGVPINGVITTPIYRGSNLNAGTVGPNGIMRSITDDNWNLLGNPYPSAISVDAFIMTNLQIEGYVQVWTHGTSPSTSIGNPYYNNYAANYTASDYITINKAGSTFGPSILSEVGSGQGFMVLMNEGPAANGTITFNNAMRNKSLGNSQFWRNAQAEPEKNRIWLNVTNNTGDSDRTLLAYVDGATNGKDRVYDAVTEVQPNSQRIYSFIDDEKLTIQSFGLTFSDNDEIPLGVSVPSQGIYSISIHALDGLFTNQTIYIKDAVTGLRNNISAQPYYFTSEAGMSNNRFTLVFRDSNLNTTEFLTAENAVFITTDNSLEVNSTQETIAQIEVYDVLGRKIITKKGLHANKVSLDEIIKLNTALIVNISLQNGQIITKKVIY